MSSISAEAPSARTKIGRRSIHDPDGTVVGYELLFRPGPGMADAGPLARDRSTTEVIRTAFGQFGLDRLGQRRHLYLNMTRTLITGEVPMPFGPHNVVLEVVEHLQVDAELVAGLVDLKQRGYRLAIDGHVAGPEHGQLLALVDVVKLDIPTAGDELADLADYVRQAVPQATLMAEGVRNQDDLDAGLAAGFDLYQGDHYQRPTVTRASDVSPSQTISLQLLSALSDPNTTLPEVERIVSADPGLSMRILGTVNSAAGAGRQINSLPQAIVMLGRRQLSAWVMLAVLGGHPDGRRQDMIDILTRARTCELLTGRLGGIDAATGYAVGLLSGVVDVMGADPARLSLATRLDDEMTAALVNREGQMGGLLSAVEQFERTGDVLSSFNTSEVSHAHLHALGTAIDTIDSILGRPE
jgi:EAL and modified HD-GYP domain-containing signal transduction protein